MGEVGVWQLASKTQEHLHNRGLSIAFNIYKSSTRANFQLEFSKSFYSDFQ